MALKFDTALNIFLDGEFIIGQRVEVFLPTLRRQALYFVLHVDAFFRLRQNLNIKIRG